MNVWQDPRPCEHSRIGSIKAFLLRAYFLTKNLKARHALLQFVGNLCIVLEKILPSFSIAVQIALVKSEQCNYQKCIQLVNDSQIYYIAISNISNLNTFNLMMPYSLYLLIHVSLSMYSRTVPKNQVFYHTTQIYLCFENH